MHSLIPKPAHLQPTGTTFTLPPAARIGVTTPQAHAAATRLAEQLDLPVTTTETAEILFTTAPEARDEAYELDVTDSQATIRASSTAGHFNAVATLLQLLPPEATRELPGVTIKDHPRYHHRGAMLDVVRHFFTPAQVKRYIDQLAAYKINYLHLHLTDDQGWRIEIKSWPNLTTTGGRTEVGGREGNLYYTQAEYADLVGYAASRGMTIIPEIDLPGHTNAALTSYPELNEDGRPTKPYTGIEVGFSSLAIHKDITYEFIDDVIGELAAITPGRYIHIGGDEALSTSEEDYATFMAKALPIIKKHGKTIIGWHEFIKTTDDTTAIAQYWKEHTTDEDVAAAAERGHKIIMSPANRVYLDMKYDKTTELGLEWAGHAEVRDAYDWDPGAYLAGVTEEHVHGVEAPLWTETVATQEDLEHLAFPRIAAAAELAWSPAETHDWNDFATRLGAQAKRWRGINYYRSPQIPWQDPEG